MHWVRITNPRYEQSRRHLGEVGEVVGRWGPENSADGREGYLVEFASGEIVGVTHEEVAVVDGPDDLEGVADAEGGGAGPWPGPAGLIAPP